LNLQTIESCLTTARVGTSLFNKTHGHIRIYLFHNLKIELSLVDQLFHLPLDF